MYRTLDFVLTTAAVVLVPLAIFQIYSIAFVGGYQKMCGCTILGDQIAACESHRKSPEELYELQAIANGVVGRGPAFAQAD